MKTQLFDPSINFFRLSNLYVVLHYFFFVLPLLVFSCSKENVYDKNTIQQGQIVSNRRTVVQNIPDSSISLISDFSINQGAFNFSMGKSLSSSPGASVYDVSTWNHLNSLGLERARVWLRFKYIFNVVSKTPNYGSYYQYMFNWNKGASSLYLNWISDHDELIASGNWTENELLAAEVDALTYYKTKFPNIEFIECENEIMDTYMTAYYSAYKFIYKVVNAVNAKNLPGVPMKIGGPTTSCQASGILENF